MKKLFSFAIACMAAATMVAQNTLVATLTHGEKISNFYGQNALSDALTTADHGDVITLSAGEFTLPTYNQITKAVTIRGVGMDSTIPTELVCYSPYIAIPADVKEKFVMEGIKWNTVITIKGNVSNVYFIKDFISGIQDDTDAYGIVNVINCKMDWFILGYSTNGYFYNSYIGQPYTGSSSESTATFINCVIDDCSKLYRSNLVNSIICKNCLEISNCAINCVSVYHYTITFNSLTTASNINNSSAGISIFKDSNYLNDLTDEAKAKYLGNDGTPVGMYGGSMPYSPTPTYPVITKMNVASKATADGKLSVDIEVSSNK